MGELCKSGPLVLRFRIWTWWCIGWANKKQSLRKNYLGYCKIFFHQIYSFYRGGFRPHRQQISLQYLHWFKNYHYLNLKCIFPSEPVMKSWFWCKNKSKYAIWICQWIIVCGVLYWNTIEYTCQSWPTSCWAEWPFCRPHGMICITSLLIRQLYHYLQQISIVGCCNWWAMTLWTVCLNTEWAIGIWYS